MKSNTPDEINSLAQKLGNKNLMSDVVGMPDEKDKTNIENIIKLYNKKNPGVLNFTVTAAKLDFLQQGGKVAEYGLVNKQASGRTLFELPEALHADIEKAYPTIFRDKKHFQWFIKNFKYLLIPEKY